MKSSPFLSARLLRLVVLLPLAAALLHPVSAGAQARSLAGGVLGMKQGGSSSASASGSQTATAATTTTAQSVQAAATANSARAALTQSLAAFQALQQAQTVAQAAALANGANNLGTLVNGTVPNPINGLGVGGLNPVGGATAGSSPSIQLVNLTGNGKNQLSLGNGGTVALPNGTTGGEQVSITGAGTVTNTSGGVTATAGSLTTTTGGTLSAASGGSITLTAGSATLSATTAATISSSVAGNYTSGGTTTSFAANQATPIPAGATVKFTGTSTATVTVTGAATVQLSGAGTLALTGVAAGTGGTISTNSSLTSFTNAVITAQPAGTTISFNGSGDISFNGSSSQILPVILEPQLNVTTSSYAPPAFTTTGSVLATTGYVVPSSWSLGSGGALSQTFNSSTGQYIDTVTQTTQQALLYWQTFNIGKSTTLDFDQSAGGADVGDWVVINRILDPSTNPSQILGAIEAPGQVYVINQNGIIFNGSSQVNTHALVASTLPINTNLVDSGLLNNADGQFLFSSVAIPSVNGSTAYDPNNDTQPDGQANTLPNVASGNITVQEGAQIYSPGSAEGVGGKIALIAPQIDNEGELSAPDGQIILAAGQQVGFDAHPNTDPSLRGLDVAVGQADIGTVTASGTVTDTATNGTTGLIYAPEADVTMTGPAIVQNGVIESLTSVALNGRIDLLAMSGLAPDSTDSNIFDALQGNTAVGGTVQLGANSITEILPDYASTATEVGTTLALPSQVYVEGASFSMGQSADLIAPNATATFGIGILNSPIKAATGATTSPLPEDTGVTGVSGSSIAGAQPNAAPDYLSGTAAVTLASGADLDVSGSSDVQASVTQNVVSAELTEAVLENSPLQRTGVLHGQTVEVDISETGTNADGSTWYGSPIGDLSGYANLVERTVGELTVAGGSVAINTNGSVALSSGSTINVSGGSINYQGAEVQTTNLVEADGQIVNISKASPTQQYTGIYTGYSTTSSKWGVTQNFPGSVPSDESYDPGYVEGGDGGVLTINASSVALNGSLYGNTVEGARQQLAPPKAGTFNLNFQGAESGDNPPAVNVVIQPSSDPVSSDPNTLDLSQDLFGLDGFSNASIITGSGNLTVASDAVILAEAGGSLSFKAANVEVDGTIEVPSGTITLTALAQPLFNGSGSYDPTIGNLLVSSGALIDTTGLTFDELSGAIAPGTLPFSVNGGKITLSGAATTLASGSSVDASGGIARSEAGTLYEGNGGSIGITGLYTDGNGDANGSLVLDGSLSAYGIGQGGSLTLTAPAVQVGASPAQAFPNGAVPLLLQASFFSQGGFANFSVIGSDGLQIDNGTSASPNTIAPILTEELADTASGHFGVSLISSSQLPAYPAAPVNLNFSATGDGSLGPTATLSMGANSSITVGATGAVNFGGQLVGILGDVTAPGGSITVNTLSSNLVDNAVTVYLGPGASLSVSGEEITAPKQAGTNTYNVGEVLPGGTISITGNIVGDADASLTANGAAGVVDVPYANSAASLLNPSIQESITPYVPETVASNGGSISINGIDEAYFAGSVSAQPGKRGNVTGTGGTLTFGSGVVPTFTAPPNAGYPELFIEPSGTFATGAVTLGEALPSGSATGGGYFTIQQFSDGGFGSLILNGNVEFEGGTTADPITINASQEVEIIPSSLNGTVFADGTGETISINAPYIEIGAETLNFNGETTGADAPAYVAFTTTGGSNLNASPTPGIANPTYGTATLTLNATDLIDVGFLSLQQFGSTNLNVPTGDIRGGGLFYASGTISLTAGQIYPPTAATFTVAAFGADNTVNGGTINIMPGVARPLPLSAGGTLNIFATDINQDGVLEAPFGVINLGALADPTTGLTPVLAGVNFVQSISSPTYVASPNLDQYAPVTDQLTLGKGSITSVSGVSSTGVALDLPYGTILNGEQWIAPNGEDITAGGLPAKAVNLEGENVNDATGSVIDLNGGGDLFAYAFNPGVGGTNDVLSVYKYADGSVVTTSLGVPVNSNSFAILPAYGLGYAPIDETIDSSGALPYASVSGSLASEVGSEIYLAGGDGLAAGTYAILPARYALITGAYLVTPTSTTPTQTGLNPDGSISMAGYIYNSLNSNQQIVLDITGFEVDSNAVVNDRAPYELSSANSFLEAGALANNQPVPRLPVDAGQLVFDATGTLNIQGSLSGQAGAGGAGSTVDIGSTDDIYIVSNTGDTPTLTLPAGESAADYSYLTLSAEQLDAFGANSLLIGGVRLGPIDDTLISPTTDNIYVENNSTTPLEGNGIILAANGSIDLEAGATIQQSGKVSSTGEDFIIGNASDPGSGDGVLLRVTGDPSSTFTRLGVNTADTTPQLTIGAGASVSGVAVTLDSSSGAFIDPTAELDQSVAGGGTAQTLNISSGAISLQVDPNVSVASAPGLVIGNSALQVFQSLVNSLSLSSYSTINLYGAGTIGAVNSSGEPVVKNFSLNGAGIFGESNGGGTVTINAQNVSLGNAGNQSLPLTVPSLGTGMLAINASTVNFGANGFTVDGYSNVQVSAINGVEVSGTGGFNAQGGLSIATPEITAGTGANFTFNAQGSFALAKPSTTGSVTVADGLGATISFVGSSVSLASEVYAPSGVINVDATSGDVDVQSGGDLEAGGKGVSFGSAIGYTNGGQVNLSSATGNVTIDSGSTVDVAAQAGGGSAGLLSISTPNGAATIADGALKATGGTGGAGGTFNATLGQASTLSDLTTPVTAAGFQTMDFDVLTGSTTVEGVIGAALGNDGVSSFTLTSEQGAITVDNTINASGVYGGTINLYADEGVTLTSNAVLSVTGQQFSSAGEGGSIDIETRGDGGGVLDIASGSQLLLGIGSGTSLTAGGTVLLYAPQTLGGTPLAANSTAVADGVAMDAIAGTISNAGNVTIAGYRIYNPAGGIDSINGDGTGGQIATDVSNFSTSAIATQLGISNYNSSTSAYQIEPGIEIVNPSGDLTLTNNWDLSSLRTTALSSTAGAAGSVAEPGILTLRAAGNLVLDGSLTDGFAYNSADAENVATSPYTWDVIQGESFSYRLAAGAQFTSSGESTANFGSVQSLAALGLDNSTLFDASTPMGSLLLGQTIPAGFSYGTLTATTAGTYAQLIRTGTGDITIDTGGSVDLMNQLATIYTAGQLAPTLADFDSPTGTSDSKYESHVYGIVLDPATQYTAQYTENGRNVSINAGQDIVHLTQNSSGQTVLDTSWQFPTNWLYRRGATSSAGVFDSTRFKGSTETASTTWWIDFSNFFEGIGALGGGNVSLNAGGNIANVDAVIPTNARMPINGADLASNLVELGGGNLSVIAGGTIEGGTYYVERGTGLIQGGLIETTYADDPARVSAEDVSLGQDTPLLLTLFVGDSSFTVEATGNVTLGSTVNPFLLPQGIDNGFGDESIFSTYGPSSSVSVSSMLGSIAIQGSEYANYQLPGGLADAYFSNASPNALGRGISSEQSLNPEPWTLTLDPSTSSNVDVVGDYSLFYNFSPPIFNATAFSGNINYNSDQTLAPSAQGTMHLLAAGTIEGAFDSATAGNGLTASITILDDDPNQLPNVVNPLGLGLSTVETANSLVDPSIDSYITDVYGLIGETPGYENQSLSSIQSQHTSGLLHDNSTSPVEIETASGDIEDFTLISPEKVDVSSGMDLEDVSMYIQNNNANDISVVTANGNITLFDPSSQGLLQLDSPNSPYATFGDIQLGGPGTLEVLAGGNLNLGEGTTVDAIPGTNLGITTIGNARNPYLPFDGAQVITAAGLGDTSGLSNSTQVDYSAFFTAYLNPNASLSSVYLPDLGGLLGFSGATDQQVWDIFDNVTDTSLTTSEQQVQASLTPEERDVLATTIFYDVLRDAGRNHNDPSSPDFGTYTQGFDAISTLFPDSGTYTGDISLTSREIKTTNGGDIDMLAPGGEINVGVNNLGAQAIDQGILTVDGGNISIFTDGSVNVGTSRIFTLHGGNIIIWSSKGNIDAGASSRTVQSAPPTRVLVDSQSANVQTDLAGLATGGGIGVLETVVGAPPGNVDLIAPVGTVNAGDAGIRASGNVNVAAAQVLNAGNIQAGGSKSGVPTTSTPNIAAAVSAANTAGSAQSAADAAAAQQNSNGSQEEDLPSIISVEVLGYGGDDDDSASTETPSDRKNRQATYLADHSPSEAKF